MRPRISQYLKLAGILALIASVVLAVEHPAIMVPLVLGVCTYGLGVYLSA